MSQKNNESKKNKENEELSRDRATSAQTTRAVNCTLAFIDVMSFDKATHNRRGPKAVASYIWKHKYPGLDIEIGLRDWDEEGADFAACIHFKCASLEEFAEKVGDLYDQAGIAPNAFEARYGKTHELTEECFDDSFNLSPRPITPWSARPAWECALDALIDSETIWPERPKKRKRRRKS
ncbi:MAG: hypothetical protein ABSH34_33360 [Verrucomicrobiota bacterium]|jgi:hypothetical protein